MQIAMFLITGTAPLMMEAFSEKASRMMRETQEAGSTARSKRVRERRDFDRDCEESLHRATEGWIGIPAGAFRSAMIDVCRLVGFHMTKAKMAVFVLADGTDRVSSVPLLRLNEQNGWTRRDFNVRNASGVADIRARPVWNEWSLTIRVRFDADQFTLADVANLIERAGMQIGVMGGRPFSRQSHGLGFGTFTVSQSDPEEATK
jgi:hypothetical protein